MLKSGSLGVPVVGLGLTAAVFAAVLGGCGQPDQPARTEAAGESTALPSVPAGVASEYATVNEEIRKEGGETTSGEWRIGYIVEPAEPWFQVVDGRHSFREPAQGETHHIEIVPFEAKSGRIVPNVPIFLEVLDASGKVIDAKPLNFYYAEFFHYANNFSVPAQGRYTLRARLDSPAFPRHGEHHEQPALSQGATVEFANVELAG